ncbi:MAG: GDP-mannose 4,6-dehydratase, partial [Verrucomicrobiota bacterium]|nr:GDP-mannose 4,6-dehydratase [Verrucomicrobiota bacterium]
LTGHYREAHGLFACSGILFNHESPLRSEAFVTRKITRSVGRIRAGLQDKVKLGDLSPRRDWGYAPEYVDAMWRMMQLEQPDDFIIATNESQSVADFAREAFACAGLDWEKHVDFDARQVRPTDLDEVRGDYGKARRAFGWEPKTRMSALVKIMVDHDLQLAEQERLALGARG